MDNHEKKQEADWELDPEYFQVDEEKKLSLEDFMEGGVSPEEQRDSKPDNALLAKTIADVRQVLALEQEGKTTEAIANSLGLDQQYVYNIQVCAQGFREDDEIAVAHLVMMG